MKTEFFKGWMRPEDFPPQEGISYQIVVEGLGEGPTCKILRDFKYYIGENVFVSDIQTESAKSILGYKVQSPFEYEVSDFEFLEPDIDWRKTVEAQKRHVCGGEL
ncbi:MAG: hypothetical protein JRD89_01655 [Deltaproteobacteria bacterium]|nr:hypothetical protein [Deltaproteobacteria bacterium]